MREVVRDGWSGVEKKSQLESGKIWFIYWGKLGLLGIFASRSSSFLNPILSSIWTTPPSSVEQFFFC